MTAPDDTARTEARAGLLLDALGVLADKPTQPDIIVGSLALADAIEATMTPEERYQAIEAGIVLPRWNGHLLPSLAERGGAPRAPASRFAEAVGREAMEDELSRLVALHAPAALADEAYLAALLADAEPGWREDDARAREALADERRHRHDDDEG